MHTGKARRKKASSNDMRTKKTNRLECGFKGHSATHRRRMLVSVGERGKRCQSANILPSSSSPRFAVTVSLGLTGSAQTQTQTRGRPPTWTWYLLDEFGLRRLMIADSCCYVARSNPRFVCQYPIGSSSSSNNNNSAVIGFSLFRFWFLIPVPCC